MQIKSVTKTTKLSAVEIWNKYIDVENWKTWDPAVKYSYLDKEFKEGSRGVLKPVGGPKTKFILVDITKYIFFSDKSDLPFAHIVFEHAIADDGETRTVTHTIKIEGLLAPLWNLIIGKKLASGLEEAVENLCK